MNDGDLTQADIVEVSFTPGELRWCAKFARDAEIGGRSNFRSLEERVQALSRDQYIGVGLGECAGNKHFFSFPHYVRSRHLKNRDTHAGDSGSDSYGYCVDYKASRMLVRKPNPLDYVLAVRPKERHEGATYILIMVDLDGPQQPMAYLVGWATDEQVGRSEPTEAGVFKGAFVIPARKLRPIRKLTVGMLKQTEEGVGI